MYSQACLPPIHLPPPFLSHPDGLLFSCAARRRFQPGQMFNTSDNMFPRHRCLPRLAVTQSPHRYRLRKGRAGSSRRSRAEPARELEVEEAEQTEACTQETTNEMKRRRVEEASE
ncbi:hypothetical protein Q5P01_005851 [Channa striata]|uniref:Uncharacterized protein n=1 Tax=Channa striata TaxID=64152 RepID=A0AA88NK58_CHASR|nr:hypothetical protein Q5P01_005851 [Channa striata]